MNSKTEAVKIKIINKSDNPLPEYATSGSSGIDLRAFLKEDLIIKPLERVVIPTGLYVEIPDGYEIQIRARSGLALKHGLSLSNGIGTIDSDYRGELGVIIINLSKEGYTVKSGDKIAQMVLSKYEKIQLEQVDVLDESKRGSGGYGHTGY